MDLEIFYGLRWIDTLGGPHLLLPQELISSWEGTGDREDEDEPDTLDPSDYTRACRVSHRMIGVIPCGGGHAVVLGEDGKIAWIPTLGRLGGFLAQPLHTLETDLRLMLLSSLVAEALNGPGAEKAYFSTGPSGVMRLFDSVWRGHYLGAPGTQIKMSDLAPDRPSWAMPGSNTRFLENEVLVLEPGRYEMRAAFLKTDSMWIVVRAITLATEA